VRTFIYGSILPSQHFSPEYDICKSFKKLIYICMKFTPGEKGVDPRLDG
jgi:hypothetical protein